jgi:hypothetical protein
MDLSNQTLFQIKQRNAYLEAKANIEQIKNEQKQDVTNHYNLGFAIIGLSTVPFALTRVLIRFRSNSRQELLDRSTKVKEHILALLNELLQFKQTRKGRIVDLDIIIPRDGILEIDELLQRFPSYRNLICHLYTDQKNKKVYDIIYEMKSIKIDLKIFDKERNEIERKKISDILASLEIKGNFIKNGQILFNKITNEILNVYDFNEFVEKQLILENPQPIQVLESTTQEHMDCLS